ncbi:hypothetical protein AB0M28_02605 [Streptomyces sp. NPDC051940]|uniref:hypothetical protein n=1 Tax=Streptomyces sp. NPDC051940 TaxID=3155675 RepID=UPI0034195E7B
MRIELAGGVTVAGRRAWAAGAAGPVALGEGQGADPGTPVALGPAEAGGADARAAVTALRRLTAAGGDLAAGAGVDLGAGFRSARLAGARGDQRDAVLAALRALGPRDADRLGERAAVLVALFGPAATKPVGAAAAQAVADGRWPAVHLASAASDVLGPEQLERLLALGAPGGFDPVGGGLPSALAAQLRPVLEPLPAPRRLALLLDLWERVLARHAEAERRRRLKATQSKQDRREALRKRRQRHDDDVFLAEFTAQRRTHEPATLAEAARWVPSDRLLGMHLDRLVADALGATALLHTAVAVTDHGVAEGLARVRPLLEATAKRFPEYDVYHANRRIPGLIGIPARPGVEVRALVRLLHPDRARDERFESTVRGHLTHARDYALVVLEAIGDLLENDWYRIPNWVVRNWVTSSLASWRADVGRLSADDPAGLPVPPAWMRQQLGMTDTLAERPGAADENEIVGDLLWYDELGDALALLDGHTRAADRRGANPVWRDHAPEPAPDPLVPRLDSVALAVSGAAQLVALGGRPEKAADWPGFTAALYAGLDVAEALDGEFRVAPEVAALDGTVVPGTRARFRVARGARTLADWSAYMGNCIAGPHYREGAAAGRRVLAALYGENGAVLANIELMPARPAVRGWLINEMSGRFNDSPDPELARHFRAWVATIPGRAPQPVPVPEPADAAGAPARRRTVPHVADAVGPALTELVRESRQQQAADAVREVYAELAGTGPESALVRLRRMDADTLTAAVRRVVGQPGPGLPGLWTATGSRPLAAAVERLDPELRERYDQLSLLARDAPLPKSLRRLVRQHALAPSYAMSVLALRVRAALGRLAYEDDPALAAALSRRPTVPLLCAFAVAAVCRPPATRLAVVLEPRRISVPGFPATSLDDREGPWQSALPAARELGADPDVFWERIAADGLRVPYSWTARGGWPALWARAQ